jgi:hypothetical protein
VKGLSGADDRTHRHPLELIHAAGVPQSRGVQAHPEALVIGKEKSASRSGAPGEKESR